MVALDTNVIVRILIRDDEAQYAKARTLLEAGRVFVPESVVLETEWVLRDFYRFSPSEVRTAFRNFFGLKNVNLTDPLKIARVLDWHEAGMGFTDAFHLESSRHIGSLKTFDKDFVKRSKEISFCKVMNP